MFKRVTANVLFALTVWVGLIFLSLWACASTMPPSQVQIIDAAWTRALALADLPANSRIPRPAHVLIYFEPRWYPTDTGIARVCGRTMWYFLPSGPETVSVETEVAAFVQPGDTDLLNDALTHEFLHVIRVYLTGTRSPDDEAWVRERVPATCR